MGWIKENIPWSLRVLKRRCATFKDLKKSIKEIEEKCGKEVSNYIRKNGIAMYPYNFESKYMNLQIAVEHEDEYPYVIHKGKKLFFKSSFSDDRVKETYKTLLMEQDIRCAHHYLSDGRYPCADDIVADVGGAEGIFSLDIVKDVTKIYIFEADNEWMEPLKRTFKEWSEKVCLVPKYVSNVNDDLSITLDDFFKEKEITYIKADVEGAERLIIEGAQKRMADSISKALICLYHTTSDEAVISKMMSEMGYKFEINGGWMLLNENVNSGFQLDKYEARRGVAFFYREHSLINE